MDNVQQNCSGSMLISSANDAEEKSENKIFFNKQKKIYRRGVSIKKLENPGKEKLCISD